MFEKLHWLLYWTSCFNSNNRSVYIFIKTVQIILQIAFRYWYFLTLNVNMLILDYILDNFQIFKIIMIVYSVFDILYILALCIECTLASSTKCVKISWYRILHFVKQRPLRQTLHFEFFVFVAWAKQLCCCINGVRFEWFRSPAGEDVTIFTLHPSVESLYVTLKARTQLRTKYRTGWHT